MCVHQSRSKHNHAHGKASNGDDNHSRRFVNVGIARHCTTYNRAKHYRTVSSARVFFGPPRPLPRLPFHQRDRCQLLMPLTSSSSLSFSRSLFHHSPFLHHDLLIFLLFLVLFLCFDFFLSLYEEWFG